MLGKKFQLTYILWAWNTEYEILLDFLVDGKIPNDLKVINPKSKWWIINSIGLCQLNTGRLEEAISSYERAISIALKSGYAKGAAISSRQEAELYRLLGVLDKSAKSASDAMDYSISIDNKEQQRNSLVNRGWVAYLHGDLNSTGAHFNKAMILEHEIDPNLKYLFHPHSHLYADYLRQRNEIDKALVVAEANLEIGVHKSYPNVVSRCHRVNAGQKVHRSGGMKVLRSINTCLLLFH